MEWAGMLAGGKRTGSENFEAMVRREKNMGNRTNQKCGWWLRMISGYRIRRISRKGGALPRTFSAEWKEFRTQEPLDHGSQRLTGAAFSATAWPSLP